MLDRIGDDGARATSIVRYAPNSAFSPHVHGGGEEFLVLDGVFQDEHGDFPAGSYVRNPPQSRHTPRSQPGCTIFVKLWQFDPADRTQVRLDTNALPFVPVADRPGVAVKPLFSDAHETVRMEAWAPHAQITLAGLPGGAELLVLEGDFVARGETSQDETFRPLSWLRLPSGEPLTACAGAAGCRLWLKTGHLRDQPTAPPNHPTT
jgi:anti-sigma factor ChrR (cupin superfamily)